jgi:antitoxin HicB
MSHKKNIHTGSSFADFLEDEELEAEVSARATKKAFVHQLEKRMAKSKSTKSKLRKIFGSPTTTSRVFDEEYTSLSLETMSKAASAVGCELQIELVPRKIAK